jgi:RNA polymerase sigma factor (sigma-70 family)
MNNTQIKLYIKTLGKLSYLGITTSDDAHEYKGSGVEWKKHIKKHGKHNIKTRILYKEEMIGEKSSEQFQQICLVYSAFYNIVESKSFVNMIPENGKPGRYRAKGKGKKTQEDWEIKLKNKRSISETKNNEYNKKVIIVKSCIHLVDKETPLEYLEKESLKQETKNILSSLTPQERKVIEMQFGIGYDREHTNEEIGLILGVGRTRISQIGHRALRKLRHPSRAHNLAGFLDSNCIDIEIPELIQKESLERVSERLQELVADAIVREERDAIVREQLRIQRKKIK